MANFKQHLTAGFIGNGVLVAPIVATGYITTSQATLLWFCGSIGSIIPDVDSDTGTAQDILFTALAFLIIYTLIENFGLNRSGLEIIGLILAGYGTGFFLRNIFQKYTVHRGIFHSVLAAIFFGLLTVVMTWYIHQVPPMIAWLSGTFMMIGVFIHLILDEIYSVDFMNAELKRSFGTAFKLFTYKDWKSSLAMLVPCLILWWLAPSLNGFIRLWGDSYTYTQLLHHFLP